MKIKAHPTTYAGTRFRSRLEARWAAFFDLAGWRWEYEPCDLVGWVPDFVLVGARRALPVEVKPINWPSDPRECIRVADTQPDLEKARRAPGEVLVLGAYPIQTRNAPQLGVLLHEEFGSTDLAVLYAGIDTVLDFCAAAGSYEFRISGVGDGDHHLGDRMLDAESYIQVSDLWSEANAVTQWRPDAPTRAPRRLTKIAYQGAV